MEEKAVLPLDIFECLDRQSLQLYFDVFGASNAQAALGVGGKG